MNKERKKTFVFDFFPGLGVCPGFGYRHEKMKKTKGFVNLKVLVFIIILILIILFILG